MQEQLSSASDKEEKKVSSSIVLGGQGISMYSDEYYDSFVKKIFDENP